MECARCGSTDRSLDASFHCSTCYAESVARVSGLERRIAELEVALERAEAAAAEADRKLRAEEFPLADKWNRAFVNMRGWMLALRSGALYSNDFIKTARVLTARALAGEECGVHNDTDLASAIESCRRYAESFNRVAELEAALVAGVDVVSSSSALGDAAAQDTESAWVWEKAALAWLARAHEAMKGGK